MVHVRRLPGLIYNYRYIILIVLLTVVFLTYKLIHWRVICTNLEPWSHVKRLCSSYNRGEVSGDLCESICSSLIHSLSCHSFHVGKEVVFTAVHLDGAKMVFKLARREKMNLIDELPARIYNSETEFELLIRNHVLSRLNISITKEESKRLARFSSGERAKESSEKRRSEIHDIWYLLQDNEYLLAIVFRDKDVFPRVIGSCGPYFAVEYLKPALEGEASNNLFENSKKESWSARVHLANMILDLLAELELSIRGGFTLCDVKPSHFGISPRSGKVKFLDLDVTFPKDIANALVANNASCIHESDCDLFDCKALCNPFTKRCDKKIINNNLQAVCEKVFLGWQISGRFIAPGLLMSEHTPPQLVSLLRQCAETETDSTAPHSVQERLMATLSEIDRVLAAAGYDYDSVLSV